MYLALCDMQCQSDYKVLPEIFLFCYTDLIKYFMENLLPLLWIKTALCSTLSSGALKLISFWVLRITGAFDAKKNG